MLSDAICTRDVVTYYATELGIFLIGYIPVAGDVLAPPLSIYHRGRYVLSLVLPAVCNRHQVIFLQENSELALSLGLTHWGVSWAINALLEKGTGVPRDMYATAIGQLLLISHICVAAHLTLPHTQKESSRNILDPVLLYQNGVGFLLDLMMEGSKTKLPKMLKNSRVGNFKNTVRNLPNTSFIRLYGRVRNNSYGRIILPQLLHDLPSFLQDPIVKCHWPALQQNLIEACHILEALSKKNAIRLSSTSPDVASSLIETLFGTPKIITKLLLQLITDTETMAFIQQLRQSLELTQLDGLKVVEADDDETLLIEKDDQVYMKSPEPLGDDFEVSFPQAPQTSVKMTIRHWMLGLSGNIEDQYWVDPLANPVQNLAFVPPKT